MANEVRLIDADALAKYLKEGHDYIMQDCDISNKLKWYEAVCFDRVRRAIEEEPTVDAVEVVRCKECRWYEKLIWSEGFDCRKLGCMSQPMPDDFCSYGERRTE